MTVLKRRLRPLLLVPLVLLAACGSKDEMLEPSPLPDYERAAVIDRLWSADTGAGNAVAGLRLQPAVTGNAVYVADSEGLVVARERVKGRLLWKRETALPLSAGPVAGYDQLFLGTREGELVSLSATDGTPGWTVALGGEVLAPAAVEGDSVLVKATDGHVTLLDRVTGGQRWMHDGGVPPLTLRMASRPLLLSDAALVGHATGTLVAIDRANGQTIWERRIAEPTGKSELDRLVDVAGDFLLSGDRLFAASYQGRVVAMDLRSGQFVWQQPVSTFQSLALAGSTLVGVDAESRVIAWRATDGVVLWRMDSLLGRQLTGCAVAGPWLVAGDYEGYLHVIRHADGVIVARKRIDGDGIAVTPVVDDGTVFVLGRSGKLAALRIEEK